MHISLTLWEYISGTLRRIIDPKQIGFNRCDGLIFIRESNAPKTSEIQNKMLREFKFEIISNLNVINFLDITFDLSKISFKLFHKDKKPPSYINIESNHPRLIIRQILNAVSIRINCLSSNKKNNYFMRIMGYMMKPTKKGDLNKD